MEITCRGLRIQGKVKKCSEKGHGSKDKDKMPNDIKLVQIVFSKSPYSGQHNEDGTQINPIKPLKTLSLRVWRPYKESLDPVILDSKINMQKRERGNLISKAAKSCPKS